MTENQNLQQQIDTMILLNSNFEGKEQVFKEKIRKVKAKREQVEKSMVFLREEYEAKMQQMIGADQEKVLDLTNYYSKQIDYLVAEVETSHKIRDILRLNNDKLKSEIETLAKVVKTSRNHFQRIELCDFDNLKA